MKVRYNAVVRTLGLWLLVLALSPVTAPFSTFDLAQFFDATAHESGAVVQSKKSFDETIADVVVTSVASSRLAVVRARNARAASATRRVVHSIPLRI